MTPQDFAHDETLRFRSTRRNNGASLRSRALALAIVLLLHLALLFALIRWGSVPFVRRPLPSPPTMLTLPDAGIDAEPSAPPASAAVIPKADHDLVPMPVLPEALPVPPLLPPPVAEAQPIDWEALTPEFGAEPDPELTGDVDVPTSGGALGSGPSTSCPTVASLRAAFEGDVRARNALGTIPRPSMSVANAVMLWDGRWVRPDRLGGPETTSHIRRVIAATLEGMPASCRSEWITGPVLVPVDLGVSTIVLAFGSGSWRWFEVLAASTE